MRLWIKIALFSILLVVVGVGVYFALSNRGPAIVELPPGGRGPGGFPIPYASGTPGAGGSGGGSTTSTVPERPETPAPAEVSVTPISDHPVFDFWMNPATSEVFYLAADGRVFRERDGLDEALSSEELYNLISVEVSTDRQRVLVSLGATHAPEWRIFDILDRAWRPLPPGIVAATWGSRPDRIIAQVSRPAESRKLVEVDLSRPSFPETALVANFELLNVSLHAVRQNTLLITEQPSEKTNGRVWNFDLTRKTLSLLFTPSPGLMVSIPRNGSVGFLSMSPREFQIFSFGAGIQPLAAVPFRTFPQKCALAASTTLCFAPVRFTGLLSSLSLPDDWLSGAAIATDQLFRTNLTDGETDLMFSSGETDLPALDAVRVEAAANDLYVLNRRDRTLYRVTMPAQTP
ncbi:MAG: hypothetical protein Q7S84_04275 [bacterium]|nr:hypothetical protein [bacterium]